MAGDVTQLRSTGSAANRIDVVFVSEGYTTAERSKFLTDAAAFQNYMFSTSNRTLADPFVTYSSLFNTSALFVASQQSGYTTATTTVNTAFGASAHLSDGRLIYGNESAVLSAVNAALPSNQHEIVVVLVNTTNYGGAGGSIAWAAAGNTSAYEVALHEIGHSYANLQDEYVDTAIASSYPLSALANSAHVATTSNLNLVPWKDWVGFTDTLGTVGAFEGGYYRATGVWRATATSKMLQLGTAFSAPEKEAFIREFYGDIGTYASLSDVSLVELRVGTPNNSLFRFAWTIDGAANAGTTDDFRFVDVIRQKADGHFTASVALDIADNTGMIRNASVAAVAAEHLTRTISGTKFSLGSASSYTNTTSDNFAIFGNSLDNTIRLSNAAGTESYVEGGGGADRIIVGDGMIYIDSGTGVDTIVVGGTVSSYTAAIAADRSIQLVKSNITDTLVGVEQIAFSDVTVVYDLTASVDLTVYKLYQAAFARMPDNTGFRFWASTAESTNMSAIRLADQFLAAPEFTQRYGANPTNTAYATAMYTNVLGRAPDSAGLNFWVGALNNGEARDQLLVDFALSGENATLVASHVSNGYWTV